MADRELIERLLFLAQTAVDQALDLNYDDPDDYFIYRELRELKAAALAQPEPQGPSELELEAIELKLWDKHRTKGCRGEGFMYDNDFSAALDEYRDLLARPEPQGPTDEEIYDWHHRCADLTRLGEADHYWAFDLQHDEVAGVVRAALARWGRSAIDPVPGVEGEP
jgi:hypothetical protein